MNAWSMALRPEERREQVRGQIAETVRVLTELLARSMTAEAFELELRMQVLWLTNAANQWQAAGLETARLLRARDIYLRREGPDFAQEITKGTENGEEAGA